MSWEDKLFCAAIFISMIIVQCFWHAALIKRNMPIKHGLHVVYYSIPVLILIYFFWPHWWQVITLAVLARLAFFDPVLNGLRRKPFFYNGAGGSIQDKIENRINGTWLKVLKIVYILLFITAFIIIK